MKLHGTQVLQIIFAVSSDFAAWKRKSKLRFPQTTVRKKRVFAYTLIEGLRRAQIQFFRLKLVRAFWVWAASLSPSQSQTRVRSNSS